LIVLEVLLCVLLERPDSRAFKDEADIDIYMERTAWVGRSGVRPYRDVFQEYPPLGAYYLAIPKVFSDEREGYAAVFYGLGGLLLLSMVWLVKRAARSALPGRRALSVLALAAPCVLFYGVNRYDALPAVLLLGALLALTRGREGLSAALFGLAIGVKWYPVAVGPLMLVLARRRIRWLAIAGGVAALTCLHPMLYAGVDPVLESYRFHLGRGANPGSLYDILLLSFPGLIRQDEMVKRLLLALQVAPGLIAAGIAVRRRIGPERLPEVCALAFAAVAGFTLFARFHSPQWHVWLAPFVALCGSLPITAYFLVADLLLYASVPLIWNLIGPRSVAMVTVSTLYYVVLGHAIVFALLRRGVPRQEET
jgi:uncharacterized membrane protein